MKTAIEWPELPLTLGALLNHGADQFDAAQLFFGHGTDNSWDEAVVLALDALALPLSMAHDEAGADLANRELTEQERAAIIAVFERRINERIPAAYITGKALFAGLEFRVTADVLVPRSPLGELIQGEFSPWIARPPQSVLDLCAGSGCIGIATAIAFPEADVDLSDISPAALEVAEHNVHAYGLHDRIRCYPGDLFAGVSGLTYDLILCNPPYVDAQDLAAMPTEYHAEPEIGLASGDDGLDFCRRLLREAPDYLNPGGAMIVEVGNSWEALEQAFPQVPFMWIEFEQGGHGVFVITAAELEQYEPYFMGAAES